MDGLRTVPRPGDTSLYFQMTRLVKLRAHTALHVSEDEMAPIGPVECPRCQRETPRDKVQCMWCGQAVSPKGVEKIEERRERMFDSALEAEDDMKERLKNVQSELEELRALGLEI